LPDDNQDGLVSEQEFLDNAPSRTRDAGDLFRKIDSNSDGYLDPDELSKVRPAPPPASWR
jgi:Ca2+-binding EF-hand superfamily protein